MHPLKQLDFPTRVAKRAQYEAFEFSLTDGGVLVRNGSHPDPSDHEYLVTVTDGVPSTCECPADAQYDGACKHRVAVAIRRPLLDAVTAQSGTIATDGGRTDIAHDADSLSVASGDGQRFDESDSSDDDDDATCDECLPSFPCWDCVRTGRKDLPE